MNALVRKAKAGVTLVELLVVMLIVVILAVGLLPMFKEYICKAQYAADAVPAIGDLRTKIGLYWYDNSKLPQNPKANMVSSWEYVDDKGESFKPAFYDIENPPTAEFGDQSDPTRMTKCGKDDQFDKPSDHFADPTKLSITTENLKGKRSRPIDFVYYNIPCKTADNDEISKTDYAYVVGCFGSGDGLAAGTGYAVCEINITGSDQKQYKYVGTFERYKAQKNENDPASPCPFLYLSSDSRYDAGDKGVSGVFVRCPKEIVGSTEAQIDATTGRPTIIQTMIANGWKFAD